MSGRVVGRVHERVIGNAARKAVLLSLADHSNPDGEMAFPSVGRIAQETELAESTVAHALGWLRKAGIIQQTHRPAQHKPATYRLNLDLLADLPLVQTYRSPLPDLPLTASRPAAPGPEPIREPSDEPSTSLDAPINHPVITVYRDEMHITPAETTRARMIEAVTDLELWKRIVVGWHDIGWNPRNVAGMLDCYSRGVLPTAGKARTAPPTTDWQSKIASDPYMKGRNPDGTMAKSTTTPPAAGQEQPK